MFPEKDIGVMERWRYGGTEVRGVREERVNRPCFNQDGSK